jgi:hypothetical protein
MAYRVETRDNGYWTRLGIGDPDAAFETHHEAESAIADLRCLGDEWRSAEYRVQEESW